MSACYFEDIDSKFKLLYKLCANGGFLLIKEHDLPIYYTDKSYLYYTFYNIYRILYNEISIDECIAENNIPN
jgi:hypothetical protein